MQEVAESLPLVRWSFCSINQCEVGQRRLCGKQGCVAPCQTGWKFGIYVGVKEPLMADGCVALGAICVVL